MILTVFRFCSFLFVTPVALSAVAQTPAWTQLPSLPEPLGVAAPSAGVTGGALLVAGGANFPDGMPWEGGRKMWHDRVWILEKPEGVWREAGKLPRPLGYAICVTWRGSVVSVGGSDSGRHFADAFRLVWKNDKLAITPLPALPIAVSGASGALADDVLYVAGGSEEPGEQSATNRAFALDLAAEEAKWRELPPIPGPPRLLAAGATHRGAFYVLGGAALEPDVSGKIARVYLREAWSYRAERGWQRLADLPRPSVAAPSPAPVVDGKILLIGGDDGSRADFRPLEAHPGFPRGILAYDAAHDRWSDAGETPAPRATVPAVEWGGLFVIPSGEVRPGVRSPEVWALRPR